MLDSCPAATVLIDGLDECGSGTQREQLLDLIVKHAESSRTKWLISSRNDLDIKQVLLDGGQMLNLELNEQHISNAVRTFITRKTEDLGKQHSYGLELKEKIKEELFAKADSTFLWVSLACKRLSKVRSGNALATLQDIPPGLNDLYLRMMDQIFEIEVEGDRFMCLEILRSITLAFRPLSIEELFTMAQLRPELNAQDLSDLIELCGSFVTIRRGIIYMVHQSAQDYLIKDEAQRIFQTALEPSHGLVASRLLNAMSNALGKNMCNLHHPGALASSATINPRVRGISYACSYWSTHLAQYLDHSSTSNLDRQEWVSDQGHVHRFLREHLLHWIEALSLIGEIDRAIQGLYSLDRILIGSPHNDSHGLKDFVHDAIRVFRQCRTPVEAAPLQIYTSALIFAPTQSIIRQTFEREPLQWIYSLPQLHVGWNPCLQTLEGQKGGISSLDFSPDGHQLVSGDSHGTIRVWDARTGKCLHELCGHTEGVGLLVFSEDGKQLASSCYSGLVRLWDAQTWQALHEFICKDPAWSLAFTCDGRLFASGGDDRELRIWDVGAHQVMRTFEGHTRAERRGSTAFARDARQLASGGRNGTIRIWDTQTGQSLHTLNHGAKIRSIVFSPDGRQLFSGDEDGCAKVWNTKTGACVQTLFDKVDCTCLCLSRTGELLAVGDLMGIIRLWDWQNNRVILTHHQKGSVCSMAFSPDGQQLVSGTLDGTLRLLDARSKTISSEDPDLAFRTTHPITRSIYRRLLTLSSDGWYLASSIGDDSVHLWSVRSEWRPRRLVDGDHLVSSVAFSPDSHQLACGYTRGLVRVWDVQTGCQLRLYHHAGSPEPAVSSYLDPWDEKIYQGDLRVGAVAFSPDGQQLAAGASDGTVCVWAVQTGESVHTYVHSRKLPLDQRPYSYDTNQFRRKFQVSAITFSSDGQRLASSTEDSSVKVWDTQTRQYLREFGAIRGVAPWVNSLSFSPENSRLAIAAPLETCIYDSDSGLLAYLHIGETRNLSFSTDGLSLRTDRGTLSLGSDMLWSNAQWTGLCLEGKRTWITDNGRNWIWLPPEFRPIQSAVSGNSVGLWYDSDHEPAVYVLSFREDVLRGIE
jgi:WD40 repeat protein